MDDVWYQWYVWMNNSLGLILLGVGIALIVIFVIAEQYLAEYHRKTKIGRVAEKIDTLIDRMPDLSD